MQKVKVKNIATNEEISFCEEPFLLSHIEGLGIPDSDVKKIYSPMQDGNNNGMIYLNNRNIILKCTLKCESLEDLYLARRKLMSVLCSKSYDVNSNLFGQLEILYENEAGQWKIYGHVEDRVDFKSRFKNTDTAEINITCDNPYFTNITDTEKDITYYEGGLKFPLELETQFSNAGFKKILLNTGDVATGIFFKFYGPAQNPFIKNNTTGKLIKINKTILANEVLEINTEYGNQTVNILNTITSERINAYNYIDLNSEIEDFKIIQGENEIEYGSDDETENTKVTAIYSNKYIGL